MEHQIHAVENRLETIEHVSLKMEKLLVSLDERLNNLQPPSSNQLHFTHTNSIAVRSEAPPPSDSKRTLDSNDSIVSQSEDRLSHDELFSLQPLTLEIPEDGVINSLQNSGSTDQISQQMTSREKNFSTLTNSNLIVRRRRSSEDIVTAQHQQQKQQLRTISNSISYKVNVPHINAQTGIMSTNLSYYDRVENSGAARRKMTQKPSYLNANSIQNSLLNLSFHREQEKDGENDDKNNENKTEMKYDDKTTKRD